MSSLDLIDVHHHIVPPFFFDAVKDRISGIPGWFGWSARKSARRHGPERCRDRGSFRTRRQAPGWATSNGHEVSPASAMSMLPN